MQNSRGSARSLAAGAADDGRTAAPSLERHGAAGDQLLRRGAGRRLRWLLAQGRCWVRLWLRPEPLPKIGDSITMHIDDPSQCLKSP
jgi:hypothetical protein